MATVLEYTTKEQRAVVLFCGQKDFMQRIFVKKFFLFTVRNVSGVKRFTTGWQSFADDEEVETEVRKWLRQRSKYFYAADFDALVKRWDKCISVGGGKGKGKVFPSTGLGGP
jgi:hypothetical protein